MCNMAALIIHMLKLLLASASFPDIVELNVHLKVIVSK